MTEHTKTLREEAVEFIKDNPKMTNVAVAKALGCSEVTVWRARNEKPKEGLKKINVVKNRRRASSVSAGKLLSQAW